MEPVAEQTVRWKLMAKESKDNTVLYSEYKCSFIHTTFIVAEGRVGLKKDWKMRLKEGKKIQHMYHNATQ